MEQINYKKKYEEALERARVVNPGTTDYNIVTVIFPELKESEDERIRKEILYVIRQLDDNTTICGRNYDFQKWIAWLEKQGETSDYNPYKATVESIAAMVEKYARLGSNLQDFYDNVKVKCKDAVEYDKTFLEKQGEQKTTDKVEPKFKKE